MGPDSASSKERRSHDITKARGQPKEGFIARGKVVARALSPPPLLCQPSDLGANFLPDQAAGAQVIKLYRYSYRGGGKCGGGWQEQDFPWQDALKCCELPQNDAIYAVNDKKKKRKEKKDVKNWCEDHRTCYILTGRKEGKKVRTVFLLPSRSRAGHFFLQIITRKKGF